MIDLHRLHKNLNLQNEQSQIIEQWTDSITDRNVNYSAIVFRMEVQCCFSMLIKLAELK